MNGLLARFARSTGAGPAAEFALVLPLILIFLLGIIDVGRFAWEVNRAEKATQTGARWAAATNMIANGLAGYSFATGVDRIPAGTPVPASAFPGISCASNGTTATCTCLGTCNFPTTADNAAFATLIDRMNDIKPDIAPANVIVEYRNSGLGFSGDPNGPNVAPIISVQLRDLDFVPLTLMLFSGTIDLPDFSYSLTMEDGDGPWSN
ncbi:TadE/TadG family type IV pilus assembly protein [Sphingopyxis alaskensis]|jgi:Flp pilus assembly protein TadG|uniref:TadE/TadG family type IV pilus assembly protein n=1 Tax=Sphingopyxis alaskensis TaxID=117207 RepID=UPI00203E64A7|nr:TadE/TadG family type IV pilus assembly protein [Sphingopyxis alaskensis]MCM3417813.1 pilus assembly protein [Sphingopyxis alaskensis]